VIFSRKRGNAGRHEGDAKGRRGRRAEEETIPELDDDLELEDDDEDEVVAAKSGRDHGPYDLADAPDDKQERLDLGALRIPAIAGVEIQLQAAPDGQIQQVVLAHGESRLQLGVFAAPRTEGIWEDLRAQLRTTLAQASARQEELTGEFGAEIKARLRDGTSTVDVRHVGIDGPRWFVHAVFFGPAATDPAETGPLGDVLRGLVVDRGTEARPVSEALPLRLPPQAAAQLAAAAQAQAAEPQTAPSPANRAAPSAPVEPAAEPATKVAPAKAAPVTKATPIAKVAPVAKTAPVTKTAPATKATPGATRTAAKNLPTTNQSGTTGADDADPVTESKPTATGTRGTSRSTAPGRGSGRRTG
jgi:hypothetical protein